VLVRTDDEIYRVDSVWLGPPRATFPWRARYVSYGLGLLVMILIMFVQRRVGIGLDFFSVAWALVLTVVVTRFIGQRIDYERPLGQVVGLFRHEVTGPRRRTVGSGGPVRSSHVRIGPAVRPRRGSRSKRAQREAHRSREQASGVLWGARAGSEARVAAKGQRARWSAAEPGKPRRGAAEARKDSATEHRTSTTPPEWLVSPPERSGSRSAEPGRRVRPGSRKGRSRVTR
jgi:hypothetical protein